MVVDVDAGITDIAVISLANTVHRRTVPIAGDVLDAALAAYVRREHQLLIGERSAERIKIQVRSALPDSQGWSINVKGRCLIEGIPREVALCDCEIRDALSAPVREIVIAPRDTRKRRPPDVSAGLMETGILLTGADQRSCGIWTNSSARHAGFPSWLRRIPSHPLSSVWLINSSVSVGAIGVDSSTRRDSPAALLNEITPTNRLMRNATASRADSP